VTQPSRHGVFGRDEELSHLRDALDDALSGRGSVVLISGEAGIGKTTLAEAIAGPSREAGAVVTWGRCPEGTGAPPFTPWPQVLRTWFEQAGSDELARVAAPSAPFLALLVPEVAEELGSDEIPGAEDPAARFRLVEAVGETVSRAGMVRPWVIVIDDLHAADPSSIAVAESVARASVDAGVLVVATYRDTEASDALVEAVARIGRHPRALHLALSGLEAPDVGRCIEAVSGAPVPDRLAHDMWSRTDGNPFFVKELTRAGESDHLPASLRAVLGARLAGLPAETGCVLETAAVFGRAFRDGWLAEATGLEMKDLLDRLEPAVTASLVEAGGIGRHRFVHQLVREALLHKLPVARRAELHGRVGEVIERLEGAALDDHLDELAMHYTEAAQLGQVDRAVRFQELAARRARHVLAFHEVAHHLARACELAQLDPELSQERRCDLFLAQGSAWAAVTDFDRARHAYSEAAAVARTLGDHHRLATAAIGHLGPSRMEVPASSIPLLDEAIAAIPREEEALRARLVAHRSLAVPFFWGNERREWAERAVRLASATDDPLATALATRSLAMVSFDPAELDQVAQLVERSMAAARRIGDPVQIGESWMARRWLDSVTGDFAGYDRLVDTQPFEPTRGQGPFVQLIGLGLRTWQHLMDGRFDQAERLIAEQREIEQDLEQPAIFVKASIVQLLWLRWWQGRSAELADDARHLAGLRPEWTWLEVMCGLASAEMGDVGAVRSILDRGLASIRTGSASVWKPGALAGCAELALATEDRTYVPVLRDLLLPWTGLHAHLSILFYLGPFDYYLGRLHAASGDHGAAIASLQSALEFVVPLGARPQVMVTRAALAEALQHRGDAGDRDRARNELAEALSLARNLQLPQRVTEYEAALAGFERQSATPGLSDREHEVFALVATGLTNQEIAEQLHVSVKTVERHLSNLYRKLGVKNRAEAVAAALGRRDR
jgi:DNA-binding CsgD family transcriptional regulator/RecA/RadA recombinase